jgi:hypothetical protein
MNIQNLSWLAGLWEGEGSVSIFKNTRETGTTKLTMTLTIVNTDPALILEVLKIADELGVTFHMFENKHDNPKWANSYQLTNRKLETNKIFLEAILPYMRGQKKQITELALRFIDSRLAKLSENRNFPNTEEEVQIFEKVSSMNKKGITKDSQILNDYTLNSARR